LRAVAQSRLGDEQAKDAFQDAIVYSISSTDPALEAEVEFYNGLTAFGEESLLEARAACRRGLDVASEARKFTRNEGYIPLEHVVSRIEELLGVIDAADGRYQDWLGHARLALAMHDRCTISDVYIQAFALKTLPFLLATLISPMMRSCSQSAFPHSHGPRMFAVLSLRRSRRSVGVPPSAAMS
jgi:hypothetical protein